MIDMLSLLVSLRTRFRTSHQPRAGMSVGLSAWWPGPPARLGLAPRRPGLRGVVAARAAARTPVGERQPGEADADEQRGDGVGERGSGREARAPAASRRARGGPGGPIGCLHRLTSPVGPARTPARRSPRWTKNYGRLEKTPCWRWFPAGTGRVAAPDRAARDVTRGPPQP